VFDFERLGEQIKIKRAVEGWSLRDASAVMGVSHTTIQRIEECKVEPSLRTLSKICKWLGGSPMDLLKEQGAEAMG
jgi:transcriptional regulator with XRE-family HTH domain